MTRSWGLSQNLVTCNFQEHFNVAKTYFRRVKNRNCVTMVEVKFVKPERVKKMPNLPFITWLPFYHRPLFFKVDFLWH